MIGTLPLTTVLLIGIAFVSLIGALCIGLCFFRLRSRYIVPVERLSLVAREYSRGNYSTSLELPTGHELFDMSQALCKIPTIYESLILPLRTFHETVEQVDGGNYGVLVDLPTTTTEMKGIAASYNRLIGIVRENIELSNQLTEERSRTQQSIMKLLDEMSGVALGDLRQQAEVTEDVTGAIADSFNYMIMELRRIIGEVNKLASNLRDSSSEVKETVGVVSKNSEVQSGMIIDITSAVDEMTDSIREVSTSSEEYAQVAEDALKIASNGSEAVRRINQSMDKMRVRVQDTSKTIKRLGERSQEIGEIVHLIGDIADRTSILALNASIQASMAGEAGLGFRVVAEEVDHLAETSAESTKKIDAFITAIQTETIEAVLAMEETTQSVVEGSSLVNDAGRALEQIERVSQQLAELIRSISKESKQLALGSKAVSQTLVEIYRISQDGFSSTLSVAELFDKLNELAKKLSESVRTFKLPGAPATDATALGSSDGDNKLH